MELIKFEFHSDIIEVINGNVSVNAICSNLGVDRKSQQSKIQLDPSFKSKFEEVEINGIIQKVLCIPLSKLEGWLFSINSNKVKPEVKQKLIEYKNECFDVLYSHFNKMPKQLPHMPDPYIYQLERENTELKRAINRMSLSQKEKNLEADLNRLKQTLVKLHDGYHRILTTCSPLTMIDELRKMTNLFQTIGSTNGDGRNLNTQTQAKHRYWREDVQQLLTH